MKTGQPSSSPSFDLGKIIDGGHVTAHFQPIVSVRNNCGVGYEGLIRGLDHVTSELIPPMELFVAAAAQGKMLELDRLCRQRTLLDFKSVREKDPTAILSLNFEASIIDDGVVGSGVLLKQVRDAGLNPRSVSLEVIESNVEDMEALQKFVTVHREEGFLISLDDVGAGHSNLNRVPLLRPDILKVDRYLVSGIHSDFYKQEVFKSMVSLSHQIGSILIAEGVETEEEAVACLEMGADMIQGFYFAKPTPPAGLDSALVASRIGSLGDRFKRLAIDQVNAKRKGLRRYEEMTREIQAELSKLEASGFDAKLAGLIRFFPLVECLYVLDETGFQISDPVFAVPEASRRNPAIFRPQPRGSNHSLREYFYMLVESGMRKTTFLSDPYLSMASGNLCVTYAVMFKDAAGKKCVLCVDINTQYLQQLPTGA